MLNFLLAVHFVLTIAIIGLILLQKHDSDGALGSSGGGSASGMFSVRGQANILTHATAILMAIFMLNCLVMAKLTKTTHVQKSVIDTVAEKSAPIKKADANVNENSNAAANVADKTPVDAAEDTAPATESESDGAAHAIANANTNAASTATQSAAANTKANADVHTGANTTVGKRKASASKKKSKGVR